MQEQGGTHNEALKSRAVDKGLKAEIEASSPVIPDVVCPHCGSLAPPTKVEDKGTYMIYKRRCETKNYGIDGPWKCGNIANVGTHEAFRKLQPANMQLTQDQFQQLLAAVLTASAAKSLAGVGA